MAPTIPPRDLARPVELAGMKSRLSRAQGLEKRIGSAGVRYDNVLDAIEEKVVQVENHAVHLEKHNSELGDMINRMIGGSNSGNGADQGGETTIADDAIIKSGGGGG